MSKNIGFIGCGNMGTAMMQGIIDSGKCSPQEIMISCRTQATLDAKKEQFGVQITTDNRKVAEFADVLFVAVKPQFYEEVLTEVRDALKKDVILISIAPGKTLQWFADLLGSETKVIRTMPNTPSMVKEGMMGMCIGNQVTEEEVNEVRELCEGFTQTEVIPEHLMDVVTAVSGSSPAYVFMFIEAMADAAVVITTIMMSIIMTMTSTSIIMIGSAKMVLETGKHPGELKDMVCSPAGTTIQAVRVLEERGMRSSVIEAMMKCLDISRNM
jgi:pyrroline-5-carboxylate reductase